MRLIGFCLVLLIGIFTGSAVHANAEKRVSVGRDRVPDSIDIAAHQDGISPDLSIPAGPVLRHGTGGAVTTQPLEKIDCYSVMPGDKITPQIRRQCATPTPRVGQQTAVVDRADRTELASQYAIDYFRSLQLPVPAPKMSSPDGVCGAVHSLDLQIPSQVLYKDPDTAFGPLVVQVRAVFEIDWGDGIKESHSSSGAPFPNSSLLHSWTTVGTYEITAVARWSATWSFGDVSGVLEGPITASSIDAWQVHQIQAVITG